MATIGKLAVLIDADNSGLKAGLKDSVAQTEQSSKAIIKNVQAIAGAFAGYLTVDMFTGMIKGAAEAGKQIDQLSKLSATSTTVFQQQAYAAQQFGISNEKLADIFKDVQDKVGQFLRDGGGPMQTFFEQIAPRVGVTAEQFRKLGGPEALQLYVNSLEKANLSQNEMTAYMEELASDSAMLLPLLRNNGAEMGRLADEAQRLGAVLSEETIKANKEFANQLDRLYSAANSLKVNIGSSLIPEITRLINEFNAGAEAAGGFWAALKMFGTSRPFDNAAEGLSFYQSELARVTRLRDELIQREGILANTAGYDREIDKFKQLIKYNDILMRSSWNLSGQRLGMNDPRVIGTPAAADTAGYRAPPKPASTGGAAKESRSIFDDGDPVANEIARRAEAWREAEAKAADAQEEAQREAFAKRIESLKEYAKTEEQIALERQAQQLKDLELGLEEGLLSEQKYMLMRQDMELKHMEELEQIRRKGMDKLKDISEMSWNEQLALTVGKIGEMTAAAASGSKAMFNINKAAAIANALLKAKESVTSAYAFGSKIGGPPLGAAMAGLAAAATAAQIGAIRSQQFGGGGSVSAGGGSATVPTQSAAAGGAGMAQTITIQGVNSGDLFSGDAVRTLIDRLIDAQRNGARIVLA